MSSEGVVQQSTELAQPDQHALPADAPVAAPEIEDEVADERLTVASQWQLIWWGFRKHKVALFCGGVLAMFYLVAIFADVVAPYSPDEISARYKLVQPTSVTFFDPDGDFTFWPGVNPLTASRDPNTLRLSYVPDRNIWYPIQLFVHGSEYKLWGLIPMDLHLFGLGADAPEQNLFLLGTDRLGRDLLSRVIIGSRLSLSIGLVGVSLSFVLGIIFGGFSGYCGGWVDLIVQR